MNLSFHNPLTSLRGFRWPSGLNHYPNALIKIRLVRLSPRQWPKVGCGAAKKLKKLNDDLIGLWKQRLTYLKNLIIEHISINSVRNKFSSLQQTVLSKTDIFQLSETKIDDSFPECFKMYCKDRNGGGLLLYVNENLSGKIIDCYKFKENSYIILYEFSVSNKKWLLLGNYNPHPTPSLYKIIFHLSTN